MEWSRKRRHYQSGWKRWLPQKVQALSLLSPAQSFLKFLISSILHRIFPKKGYVLLQSRHYRGMLRLVVWCHLTYRNGKLKSCVFVSYPSLIFEDFETMSKEKGKRSHCIFLAPWKYTFISHCMRMKIKF